MMANYPLVLAIEPRLLPYARANGFTMDHKVRFFFSALHYSRNSPLGSSLG